MGVTYRVYRAGLWLDVSISSEQMRLITSRDFDLSEYVEQETQRLIAERKRKQFKISSQPIHQKLIALFCRKRKDRL